VWYGSPPHMSRLPLNFDEHGLVPVIVQDRLTGEIRMFAFATNEAVRMTLETGRATSGNEIKVERVLVDCDSDCLVYSGDPHGNSCHTGAQSCFFQTLEGEALTQASEQPQTLLATLESVLEARRSSTASASYTKSLYDKGAQAIGGKILEEAGELARAIESESDNRVVSEAADALYHVFVGLKSRSIPLRRVLAELARRMSTSGHEEKASRPKAPKA